jgi:hypothetical protein
MRFLDDLFMEMSPRNHNLLSWWVLPVKSKRGRFSVVPFQDLLVARDKNKGNAGSSTRLKGLSRRGQTLAAKSMSAWSPW